jgi:hypothetical protein
LLENRISEKKKKKKKKLLKDIFGRLCEELRKGKYDYSKELESREVREDF